jgi:hypothetical protein
MGKFLLHGAAELYISNTDEEKQAFLDTMKEKLGAFKSGKGKVETLAEAEDMDGGLAFEAVYVCDAVFEKQKARIKMVLLRRQSVGDWSIVSFDVWPENQPEEEPAATPPSA